jgi:DNA phosphorothioation-dependent restriction protein DptH
MFFMDFIRSGSSRFRELAYDAQGSYRKFPILEKICCPETGGGRDNKRVRILSNQRFKMGTLHAEVMAHIKQGHAVLCKVIEDRFSATSSEL